MVLVGGSTRIPFVRKMLGGYFGKDKVNTEVNPDEAVAVGAGMQASILAGEQLIVPGTDGMKGEMVLLDVTPLSMGIEVVNGIFSPIIQRNTAVPTRKSKTYTTVSDNQQSINIEVFQGDSDMARPPATTRRRAGHPPLTHGANRLIRADRLDRAPLRGPRALDR